MDSRISITDCAEIALEVTNVDRIEPDLIMDTSKDAKSQNGCPSPIVIQTYNRDPESHVSFCKFVSDQVVFSGDYLFNLIERIKHFHDSLLVRHLGGCEAGSVHAIYRRCVFVIKEDAAKKVLHTVDTGVDPGVQLVNLGT